MSRGSTFADCTLFFVEHCCNCGLPFAFPDEFKAERIRDKKTFYCPNGHSQNYIGKSLEQQLREAQASLNEERGLRRLADEQRERARIEAKKAQTRAKNAVKRAEAGCCPHCKRTFQDVRRHLFSKHGIGADPAAS